MDWKCWVLSVLQWFRYRDADHVIFFTVYTEIVLCETVMHNVYVLSLWDYVFGYVGQFSMADDVQSDYVN